MKPLVSICVPTYNGARHLRECLDSVLAQTFGDFELLLVDDGSSDDTVSIAREYATRDKRVRIEQNEHNLGLVGNWNRCVELAQGTWIKYVFQDDLIAPTCLEKLVKSIDPGTFILCCRRDFVFGEGIDPKVRNSYLKIVSLDALFFGKTKISSSEFADAVLDRHNINFVGEPTSMMLHRNAFYRFGTFNRHFISLCDYEYWLRVAVNTGLTYVPETLATFRVHGLGTTALDRENRSYRMRVLDPLLILHELALNPLYEPLRAVAAQRKPAFDLINLLAFYSRRAWRLAGQGVPGKSSAVAQKIKEWDNLVRYYPNLKVLSRKLFIHSKILKAIPNIFKLS